MTGPPAATAQQQGSQHIPLAPEEGISAVAQKLMGIELTEAQESMALPDVDRNLTNYETLHKISVPPDTEPAFTFVRRCQGKNSRSPVKRFLPGRIEPASFKSVEDLAFSTTLRAICVGLHAHSKGIYLGDPKFDPPIDALNRRNAAIFVHPSELPGDTVPGIPAYVADFLLDSVRVAVYLPLVKWGGR